MTTAYGEVRGHLQKNARYNKRCYDIKVRPRDYEQGQWVWYLNLRKPLRKQQKWISQYEGPYLIIRMLSPLTVEIQKDPRVAPKIVHVDKLKPCKDPPLRSRMTPRTNPSSPRTPTEEQCTPSSPTGVTTSSTRPPRRRLTEALPEPEEPSSINVAPTGLEIDDKVESGIGSPTQDYSEAPAHPPHSPSFEPRRPARHAQRPSRYQDDTFETQFVPSQRGRRTLATESQSSTAPAAAIGTASGIRVVRWMPMSHDDVEFQPRKPPNCKPPLRPLRFISPRTFFNQWRRSNLLEESRTRPVQSENSIQPVESQSTEMSPMTRSSWSRPRYQHDQSTSSSVQRGLSLSSACLSWSEADNRQPKPDQSNSRLPVRLASPKKFYQQWIQQCKVPPDRVPSVPVHKQPDCPVDTILDDGDATLDLEPDSDD